MPYMSDTEKRYRIFSLFCYENQPRTLTEIARQLGYKESTPVRKLMKELEAEGMFRKHVKPYKANAVQFFYTMVAGYEEERDRLGRLLKSKRYNGIL